MSKPTTMQKVLGGLLIGGMLLGGASLALANNDNSTGSQSGAITQARGSEKFGGRGPMNSTEMQPVLDGLVTAGTLTQAQAEQIQSKIQQLESERQAQRDQMQSLTQEERQAERDKMQSMTQEERQAYFGQNRPAKQDLFTTLVSEGTLTQEQADAIHTALQSKMQEQRQAQLSTALSALVEKGSIDAAQSDAILDKLAEVQNTRQQEMAAMSNLTAEERQAQMQANKPERVNPLADLVTAGILTQAQADEVQQAIGHSGGRQGDQISKGQGHGDKGFSGMQQKGNTGS
jgi:polyhydroxyalkanoate synthesis regulator phasin